MKTEQLIIIAAAGAGLYMLSKLARPLTGAPARAPGRAGDLNQGGTVPVTQVQNTALPGDPGWGWSYYSDGTAISPSGDYYLNGQRVYNAASVGMMGGV